MISRSGADNYENLGRHADAALLVNTTPVGMFPNDGASPVDLRRLPGLRTVLDVVYNPLETALLLQARALGLRAENGLSMLVGQGCAAAERFTGSSIPAQTRDRALQALRRDSTDLILIGMPGSGKTTLRTRAPLRGWKSRFWTATRNLRAASAARPPGAARRRRGCVPRAGDVCTGRAGQALRRRAGDGRRLRHAAGERAAPAAKRLRRLGAASAGRVGA